MANEPESTEIADDEFLYRRIPVSKNWYHPSENPEIDYEAFRPREDDKTGLSMERCASDKYPEFRSMAEIAQGKSKQGYVVAELRAGDLLSHGIDIVPRPVDEKPGHVELPQLRYDNRDSTEAANIMQFLSLSVRRVVTFPTQ